MIDGSIGGFAILVVFVLIVILKLAIEIEFRISVYKKQKKNSLGDYLSWKDFAIMTDEHKMLEKLL